ncbi:DUF4362 domain-containing protein [Paenibacillus sp. DMB20]|uniref:DUF4362 domain-containing protein n=1 Tax=Paenibacillus sp. DMB20 TaxID=1642570 RepID=UPI0009E6530B|nr:DUF4362 domain-containing protein [Paenibacillus sp. DMB20]
MMNRSLCFTLINALLLAVFLTSCSPKINKAEDVIDTHGKVSNLEKLDQFMEQSIAIVRIVRYTVEGDPIFYALSHADDRIALRYDPSQDKYGSSEIVNYVCDRLEKKDDKAMVEYVLTGCDGRNHEFQVLQVDEKQ